MRSFSLLLLLLVIGCAQPQAGPAPAQAASVAAVPSQAASDDPFAAIDAGFERHWALRDALDQELTRERSGFGELRRTLEEDAARLEARREALRAGYRAALVRLRHTTLPSSFRRVHGPADLVEACPRWDTRPVILRME